MADDSKKKTKSKIPSAVKRERLHEERRIRNKSFRSKVSTAIKTLISTSSPENLSSVYSLMDKGVKKGVFTKNKASRFKSRITKRVAAKA